MASGAAAAGGPAAEQPWPMRCTACNASLGTGALVVIVVPLKTGVGRHAFTGTYDGYGACETTAGEVRGHTRASASALTSPVLPAPARPHAAVPVAVAGVGVVVRTSPRCFVIPLCHPI